MIILPVNIQINLETKYAEVELHQFILSPGDDPFNINPVIISITCYLLSKEP